MKTVCIFEDLNFKMNINSQLPELVHSKSASVKEYLTGLFASNQCLVGGLQEFCKPQVGNHSLTVSEKTHFYRTGSVKVFTNCRVPC